MHTGFDKIRLLELIRIEYDFFERTLLHVGEAQMLAAGVCGHWSVKDLVAHLTAWETLLLGWIADKDAGKPLTTPHPDFDWDAIDALNDHIYQQHKDRTPGVLLAESRDVRARVLDVLSGMSEPALLETPFTPGRPEPLLELIRDNTFGHYAEHLEQIRAWLNAHAAG